MNKRLIIMCWLLLSGCKFDPVAQAPKLEIGQMCSSDDLCISTLCAGTCVECRASDPCPDDGQCLDGRCQPQTAVVPVGTLGGPLQVDEQGRQHRGRVAVPAVSTHRSTAGGQ